MKETSQKIDDALYAGNLMKCRYSGALYLILYNSKGSKHKHFHVLWCCSGKILNANFRIPGDLYRDSKHLISNDEVLVGRDIS